MLTHVKSPIKILPLKAVIQLSKMLMVGSDKLKHASLRMYQLPKHETARQWFHNMGDQTHRINYDLNNESIVFDVGGYKGQWSSDIFAKYCCFIHVFEPVNEFADFIEQRFAQNSKIFVYRLGLSDQNQVIQISVDGDKSSAFGNQSNTQNAQLMRAMDFIEKYDIKHIDLMKINIEGGEYSLLEHLILSDFVKNIKDIQVQFHDFFPQAGLRMSQIQAQLRQTHHLTYQYPFIWENWTRKI